MPPIDPDDQLLRALRASAMGGEVRYPEGASDDELAVDPQLARIGAAMTQLRAERQHDRPLDDLPPPELWDAIAAELDLGQAPTVGSVPSPTTGAPVLPLRRRSRRTGWLAAAAAVVAVALGAAVLVSHQSGPTVISEVALEPLEGSGSGAARLLRGDDDRVRLEVSEQFAAVPAGTYVEVWLIDPGSDLQRMVSLGAVEDSGTYDIPRGIDPAQYSVVDISIEPADGEPTHSGRSILRGTLEQPAPAS